MPKDSNNEEVFFIKQYLEKSNTPGIVLLACTLLKLNTECLAWDPLVLRKELEESEQVKMKDSQFDRLMAAMAVLQSPTPMQDWTAFETVCNILVGLHDTQDVVTPVFPEYLPAALAEIELIRLGDPEGLPWSPEVRAYVGTILGEYGLTSAPDFFPSAIMPTDKQGEEHQGKKAALREVYNTRRETLIRLLEQLKQLHDFQPMTS
jgi:hypothetical protein